MNTLLSLAWDVSAVLGLLLVVLPAATFAVALGALWVMDRIDRINRRVGW